MAQFIAEGCSEEPPILLTLIQGLLMMLIILCLGLFMCIIFISLVSSLPRDRGYDFYQVKSGATNHLSEFTTREFNYLFDVKSDRWKFFTNLGEFDLEREYNNDFIPDDSILE